LDLQPVPGTSGQCITRPCDRVLCRFPSARVALSWSGDSECPPGPIVPVRAGRLSRPGRTHTLPEPTPTDSWRTGFALPELACAPFVVGFPSKPPFGRGTWHGCG